ncbi:hypothetical protein [Cyclobacterium qasimii]|uniref:Uncharacterized protein n=1 Tax=Cyclobacterium qasimii M12-11B TaxID=641524 RepID=S7VPE0_9BACT|nr:hypothetical protein [Cyclobacterium qasimii]EPR71821.1 hypothetical protein ADICYQ_0069 [Cyclobacterium qasimii M12-11B]
MSLKFKVKLLIVNAINFLCSNEGYQSGKAYPALYSPYNSPLN